MNRFSFHYKLKISMDSPVTDHRFTLRCTPPSDGKQIVSQFQRSVSPCDFLSDSRDGWGNALVYGCCRGAHSCFEAVISGTVSTGLSECTASAGSQRDFQFAFPTPLTSADAALKQFASQYDFSGSNLSRAERIMSAVNNSMDYIPGSTTVLTSASQAFATGCGVCQDYSHVMLSALRSLSIPCRYVVGMVPGEGETHAWVEVLNAGAWYGLDPTHCCQAGDGYIKISHGRDYNDCVINRGLFRGNAAQKTEVSAIVMQLN